MSKRYEVIIEDSGRAEHASMSVERRVAGLAPLLGTVGLVIVGVHRADPQPTKLAACLCHQTQQYGSRA